MTTRSHEDFHVECLEFAVRLDAIAAQVRDGLWPNLEIVEEAERVTGAGVVIHSCTIELTGRRTLLGEPK